MTKKIIAGVLAFTLVMGSAAIPNEVFENIAEKTGITAGAYSTSVLTVNNTVTGTVGKGHYCDVYSFTPSEKGYYQLISNIDDTSNDVSTDVFSIKPTDAQISTAEKYKDFFDDNSKYGIDNKTLLSAGKTYYFTVYKYDDNVSQDYSLTLENFSTTKDGITYRKQTDGQHIYSIDSSVENAAIPNKIDGINVVGIDNLTGMDCNNLKSVSFPSTLVSIGYSCFSYSGLTGSIVIPSSVEQIGADSFYDCDKITSVTIGKGVKTMSRVFCDCDGFSSVDIPANVENCLQSFTTCGKLVNINVSADNPYFSSEDGVLMSKNKTYLLVYPQGKEETEYTIPDSVIDIDGEAFEVQPNLRTINIGKNLIGSPTINDNSEYYEGMFTQIGMKNGYLDGSKYKTDSDMFYSGDYSYYLSNPFTNMDNLKAINVDSDNKYFMSDNGILLNKSKTNLISVPANCGKTTFTVPNTVTQIAPCSFYGNAVLETITIPSSVKLIGSTAFLSCPKLKTVNIDVGGMISNPQRNEGLVSYYNPFGGSTSLEKVNVTGQKYKNAPYYSDSRALYTYSYFPETKKYSGKELLTYFSGNTSSTYNIGNDIWLIGANAFVSALNLSQVTISQSVTAVGDYAFWNCIKMKSVVIPDTLTSIGYCSFGYYSDNGVHSKMSDFKIYCVKGTEGEKYAIENGFDYELYQGDIANRNITLSKTSYVYTGSEIKPKVTVDGLVNGTDYTVSYSNNTKVGTATVKITGKGNYTGTVTKTFKITAISISKATMKLSKTSYSYSGKVNKPAVTVKYGKTTLKNGTDYTVSYKNNKFIGTATVVVKGKGKYGGTKNITFKINPKKQTVKLTSYDNAFKATWKKDTLATGYQAMYAKAKSFKGSKTYTVSNKTLSKKIKGKNKTTYYVKVRTYKTVKGTKCYGAWSTIKTIKTK